MQHSVLEAEFSSSQFNVAKPLPVFCRGIVKELSGKQGRDEG